MIKEELLSYIKEGRKEDFLKRISSIMPPSDDVSISLGKLGLYEYIVDRKGFCLIQTAEDEYLPYLSSNEKRIEFHQIPKSLVDKMDYTKVLEQLKAILEQFGRRDKKYLSLSKEIGDLIETLRN
ncbi:hypothetical protein [Acidianus sp. HS-5]|uniref:hypothetical protein n=1 Tax=Acidianus sp. HS-5 TaxID=2886040 RepID=UPI001F241304|nr:hypothetical protein [Acidianus sp. HS-5]BDC18961.1 hypothetical protein HS5_18510 [Acidianus sp. HS-5]